jgi:hypothetical protein
MATMGSVLWVCEDCRIVLANDDWTGIREDELPGYEVRFRAGCERETGGYGHIVAGGPHGGDCTDEDRDAGCDCDYGGFMRQGCDLCRDGLGGDKYAATVLYG